MLQKQAIVWKKKEYLWQKDKERNKKRKYQECREELNAMFNENENIVGFESIFISQRNIVGAVISATYDTK